MKKEISDFKIVSSTPMASRYSLIKLTPASGKLLPQIDPGQFVQVEIPDSKSTFLRRPISVNFVDRTDNTLHLLVRNAGSGTEHLINMPVGAKVNIIYPLGNGFSMPEEGSVSLLVGGGVGVAPLLYFGHELARHGRRFEFLIGARTAADVLLADEFAAIAPLNISTDDGSLGEHGLVTKHSALTRPFTNIYCCGPAPMMKGVAAVARQLGVNCEVSLENMMACGLGACLCCVENTVAGNVCVCTEGPVFNINQLTW